MLARFAMDGFPGSTLFNRSKAARAAAVSCFPWRFTITRLCSD